MGAAHIRGLVGAVSGGAVVGGLVRMLKSKNPPRCKYCRERTEKVGKLIHDHCIDPWLAVQLAKQQRKKEAEKRAKAKVERARDRKRRQDIKTRRDWIAEAQVAVNRCARLRDLRLGRGCISCGARPEACFGGSMDAGHFRSVGSAPHLRFYLPQIRLQCVRCNRYLSGNVVEFRRGLVALLGLEPVEGIEAMQGVRKWDVDYLQRLKRVMTKKAKRIEKRMEAAYAV